MLTTLAQFPGVGVFWLALTLAFEILFGRFVVGASWERLLADLLILAAYVAFKAVESLVQQDPPAASYVGIGLAVLSVIVISVLARARRRVAVGFDSRAMHADSKQTDICGYLSAILLIGLGGNALLGWWWPDPVAALAMAPIISNEGIEAMRGEKCGCEC